MPEFDNNTFKSGSNTFAYSQIIQIENPAFISDRASIYGLPTGAPPTPNTNTLLILPDEIRYEHFLDAFAQANISFTVASSNALTNLNYSTVIVPYDPTDSGLSQKLLQRVYGGTTLIVLNEGTLGTISNVLNLVKIESIVPIESGANWTVTTGTGQIRTTAQNNQTFLTFSGKTDASGSARVDYTFSNPTDLSSVKSFLFNFLSKQTIQSVRFALFDNKNNFDGITLPAGSVGNWTDYTVGLSDFTETSNSLNSSSILRIRVGLNAQPNSTVSFDFSGVNAIFQTENNSATGISYKGQTLGLPSNASVPVLNVDGTVAFYTSNNSNVSPLMIEKEYGAGRILYLNLLPLADKVGALKNVLDKVLPWIKDTSDLSLFNWNRSDASKQFDMYSQSVSALGSIIITSNSMVPVSGFSFNQTMPSYSEPYFSLATSNVKITPSSVGTYSTISASGPFNLTILNGSQSTNYSIANNCTFLFKDPQISVNGSTSLQSAYWRNDAAYWGNTLVFDGKTSFSVWYSSVYLLIFNFNYEGHFNYASTYSNVALIYPSLQQAEPTLYLSVAFVVMILVAEVFWRKRVDH